MNYRGKMRISLPPLKVFTLIAVAAVLFWTNTFFAMPTYAQVSATTKLSASGFSEEIGISEELPGAIAQVKDISLSVTSYSKIQEQAKNIAEPSEKPGSDSNSEDEANQSCLGCHAPEILRMYRQQLHEQVILVEKSSTQIAKPVFVAGELNLAIDEKKYSEGVHGSTGCLDCHQDIKGQKQRLKSVACQECHEEPVESVRTSAHARMGGAKATGCLGCHDVHYGKEKVHYLKDFNGKICVDCHQVHGMDAAKQHKNLYETRMHLVMDCMLCHSGERPGVHNIPADKGKAATCESCHNQRTILSKGKQNPAGAGDHIRQIGFINGDALQKFGYVIGAHRIPLLDALIILAAIVPLGLCIAHGATRLVTIRKIPIHLPEEFILLHPLIERIWHWVQAICTIVLITTGAMLHWPEKFPGWFDWAVKVHNWFGIATVLAFVLWLVYNLVTGRISHYFPKAQEIASGITRQVRYYVYGIFRHEPHPHHPTEDNKFNPLQKIAYLQFQLFILPIVLVSGLLYMYPDTLRGLIDQVGGMALLGTVHFFLGGLFAAFLVAHIYLATTGETIGENFKAIITGYGIKSHHPEYKQ